jgi:hypothetical protein
MPRVGFKTTIPASEQARTVHALDCSATVAGFQGNTSIKGHDQFYLSFTFRLINTVKFDLMFSSFSIVWKPISSANDQQLYEMSSIRHIQTNYKTASGQTL